MASRGPHAPEQKAADENMTIKNGGRGLNITMKVLVGAWSLINIQNNKTCSLEELTIFLVIDFLPCCVKVPVWRIVPARDAAPPL